DHALHNRVVLMNLGLRRDSRPRLSSRAKLGKIFARSVRTLDRPEAQRIHHGHGPRPHGENIAQNSPHPGGRALKRLDERRMIMRLDLERTCPAVTNVDDARILPWPL